MEKIALENDCNLDQLYNIIHKGKGARDIHEHMQTLCDYAYKCKHITEFGVRNGNSTVAFMSAKPLELISYDIKPCRRESIFNKLSIENNIKFNFIQKSVLNIEIEETDLLFIDTLHTYNQLKKELDIHAKKVRKYIILHDTVTFGYRNEINDSSEKSGLVPAMNEFLESRVGNWFIVEKIFTNNNGLTILKRRYE